MKECVMKLRAKSSTWLALVVLLMVPAVGLSQDVGGLRGTAVPVEVGLSAAPDTFGISSQTVVMIGSFQFQAYLPSTTIATFQGIDRYVSTSGGAIAHADLPNGALVEKIELRACDTSATDAVVLYFYSCATQGALCSPVANLTTGAATMPGCGNFAFTLASPLQVDNQVPLVLTIATGTSSATTFSGVKVYYRLQVSPAPAVATFPNDVPTTHPFFKYVEALAAAGITGGCGAGSYCPDSPVTRGQMAVFLSVALGLHWPN